MTANSKRLAILLGEAVAVVAIDYVMSSRPERQDPDLQHQAARRRRFVWLHAIVGETLSFMIDEVIRQRQRAEIVLERAAIAATLPSQPAERLRLPQQPTAFQPAATQKKARPTQA